MMNEDEYITLLGTSCPTNTLRVHHEPGYQRPRKCSLAIEINSSNKIVPSKDDNKINQSTLSIVSDASADSSDEVGKTKLDGGWGWVVVIASFLCLSILDGVSYSFGILMEPLMTELGVGRGGISVAGSLQTGIYALSGLVVSKFVTKYGTRIVCIAGAFTSAVGLVLASFSWNLASLYITYSALTGFGFGMMYIPAIVAVAEHFDQKRALALGICVCGTGVGTFFLSPLESFLLADIGWRWTLVCLGCCCLCCVLCGIAMTPVKGAETPELTREILEEMDSYSTSSDESEPPIKKDSWGRRGGNLLLGQELANHNNLDLFLMLVVADAVGTLALFIPFTYLPDLAVSVGVPTQQAAMLLSAGGICSSVGRILSGYLNDKSWCNAICLTSLMVFVAAFQPLLLTLCSGYALFMTFSCAFGFATGVWIAATTPFLLKVLPIELLSPAFGVITATQGVAALAGSPLAGALVDLFGHVQIALTFASCLLFLSAVLFAVSFYFARKREVRSGYQQL